MSNKYGMAPSMSQGQAQEQQRAYADITIVFDRSASMMSLKPAVLEGFNDYVRKMRQTPGDSKWTMVQFDDRDSARGAKENFPNTVFSQKSETEVPFLEPGDFKPRGSTALVDACCEVIKDTELRTSGQEVKVIIGIFTDGMENASQKHTSAEMREMIARVEKDRGFEFLYFGANQDAFQEAQKHGIQGVVPTAGFGAHYGSDLLSGGLARSASKVNNFECSRMGMMMAIASGMVGISNFVSGSITEGKLYTGEA